MADSLSDDARCIPDRRHGSRRVDEQRLHLARELVIAKARQLTAVYLSDDPMGEVVDQLADLAALVAVLDTYEGGDQP